MRVSSIQPNFYHLHSVKRKSLNNSQQQADMPPVKPVFKGDRGALIGIVSGAAIGAGITALTVLTGGLAAIVAAVGPITTIIGGAGIATHVGGIAGSIIEDQEDKKNNK